MIKNTIQIKQGMLSGVSEDGYSVFYNIPYASDRGRFKIAGDAPAWECCRDASQRGPVFPQMTGRLSFVMGNTEEEKYQSESNFTVNIWTPDVKGNYPVLFWMHGGAFMTGGGAIPWYGGEKLAKEAGIVVVNISYRLGVLGNIYMPEAADTNLSVHDVNQALIWVHENIADFGGDPENITIAGQSAGAWYAVLMLGNPALKGLFRRAGLFSFNGGTAPYLKAEAEIMTRKLADKMNLEKGEQLLDASVEDILMAQKIAVNQPERLNIPFLPVIDNETIYPDYIRQSAVVSDPSVEIFCGTVAHESTPFVARKEGEEEEAYLKRVQHNTDIAFVNDTELLMQVLRNAGHTCYRYVFAYESVMKDVHTCHCFDIPFLLRNFEDWSTSPFLNDLDVEAAKQVSEEYSSAFVAFMKNGTPGDNWKPYDGTEETCKIIK